LKLNIRWDWGRCIYFQIPTTSPLFWEERFVVFIVS